MALQSLLMAIQKTQTKLAEICDLNYVSDGKLSGIYNSAHVHLVYLLQIGFKYIFFKGFSWQIQWLVGFHLSSENVIFFFF